MTDQEIRAAALQAAAATHANSDGIATSVTRTYIMATADLYAHYIKNGTAGGSSPGRAAGFP